MYHGEDLDGHLQKFLDDIEQCHTSLSPICRPTFKKSNSCFPHHYHARRERSSRSALPSNNIGLFHPLTNKDTRASTAQPDLIKPTHLPPSLHPLYNFLTSHSLRHNLPNRPPEITPHPPATLPRIRIHNPKRILRIRRHTLPANRVRTRRVQIKLVRRGDRVNRPVTSTARGSVVVVVVVRRDAVGDGRVVGRDEVAPDFLESCCEGYAEALAGVVEISVVVEERMLLVVLLLFGFSLMQLRCYSPCYIGAVVCRR